MITMHLNNTKNTNYPQNLEILSCLDKLLLAWPDHQVPDLFQILDWGP